MRTEIHLEAATPAALRRQVVALQDLAWPGDSPTAPDAPTHDPALRPVSVLLVDGEQVVAALDVLAKELTHAGTTWDARGLSTVVVHPDRRGTGTGGALLRAARPVADGGDLTVFTCDRPLAGFYGRAGYAVLPGTVLVGGTPEDPLRSDSPGMDKVTVAALHSPRARRADFVGVDLPLYSGSVDRLW